MFLKSLFRKKRKQITIGDVVILKKTYLDNFPIVSKDSLLKVENISNEKAFVVFMNDLGNKVYRETIPLYALAKVG